jgi:hypothetical protein
MKKNFLSLLVAVGLISGAKAQIYNWDLNGNANDSIGNANGTAFGVQWVTSNFNGIDRTVAQMNGDGGINISNVSALALGSTFSLNAWVNPSSWGPTGGNYDFDIFMGGNTGGGPHDVALRASFSANYSDFAVQSTDHYYQGDIASHSRATLTSVTSNGSGVQLNRWNMLTWTYDGNFISSFLNGQLMYQAQSDAAGSNLTPYGFPYFTLGNSISPSSPSPSEGFIGELAVCQIYNTALTANQVSVLYAAQSVPEPSTYALFGIGAMGMLMVIRRKKIA